MEGQCRCGGGGHEDGQAGGRIRQGDRDLRRGAGPAFPAQWRPQEPAAQYGSGDVETDILTVIPGRNAARGEGNLGGMTGAPIYPPGSSCSLSLAFAGDDTRVGLWRTRAPML